MTRISRILFVAIMTAVFPCAIAAQNVASGELDVTVRDAKGALITNATVTARDEAKAFERSTKQNTDGEYRLLALPPSTYTVTIEAPGFAKAEAKGVSITVGQVADLPVTLQVSGGQTTVTVSTEADLVETTRTSTTDTIDQRRIDNLPINGRNYIDFTKTDSQVVQDAAPSIGAAPTSGLNFGGQRARGNLVNVDGADAVDNSTNGIRSTVSQEAVQEFQIITNGFAAEYGRASGGVVNIITRSGSNALHGSIFGYLRNRNFQAVNPFSNVKDPAYTRVQAGASLGGALKKDKTFFYLAYEVTRRHETGFSDIGANNFGLVPSDASFFYGAPAGTFAIQATPEQAAFIAQMQGIFPFLPAPQQAALLPGMQKYAFLVGGSSGIGVNGTYPAAFALITPPVPNQLAQFPTTCNSTNLTCNGLPTGFLPLAGQQGNFPVFEGTSLYSLRLDHNINNYNRLMLRANISPSTVDGIEVNAQNQNFGQNAFSRTSVQSYRDVAGTAQETWTSGTNKVNEFRFQYARRGLNYNFAQGPGGSNLGVNIGGFAYIGREPFSYIRRSEQRYQFTDNFSWTVGRHDTKFGVDFNYLPVDAIFTVNYGGVINFGAIEASSLGFPDLTALGLPASFPSFSPVQAYGLGIPTTMVQGYGNPHDSFKNKPLGVFWQDSWRLRSNLTLNYGVRYDVEFTPKFALSSDLAKAAYDAIGIQKGVKNDTNNFAPRVGISWDPRGDGKTALRGSYGIFYDHPLLGLFFLGDASDGSKTGQLIFAGGSPCNIAGLPTPVNMNATNIFQGILGTTNCLPPGGAQAFGYVPNEQRFDPFFADSLFLNQAYLNPSTFFPLVFQPFGFPQGKGFVYAYSHQANFTLEHDLGHGFGMSVGYNFNAGHHLNRPIQANAVHGDLLVANWRAALADSANSGVTTATNPLFVQACGVGPGGAYIPAPVVSFFRQGGLNPALAPTVPPACLGLITQVMKAEGLGFGPNRSTCDPTAGTCVTIPFSDMSANYSNGSSVYHALTANVRKQFTGHTEFLASYTWSHAIDDSTDLQSLLSPQDSYNPSAEKSSSTFDQRHRFVFSGVYQTGKLHGDGFASKLFSDWTFAPIIQLASGRPFNVLTGVDTTFQAEPSAARPNIVPAGTGTSSCGDAPVASKFSPTGFFQLPCFIDGGLAGNAGRNIGQKPWTAFNDLRISRRLRFGERVNLEAAVDIFNIANRYNVADVNPLYTQAGTPTAASDPRQFQFSLRLAW